VRNKNFEREKGIMTGKLEIKVAFFVIVVLISAGLLFSHLFRQKDVYIAEEKINTAQVFFDVASKEDRIFEMEVNINYQRYRNPSKHFILSVDEAGDHVFNTVLDAYREAASNIPFSEIVTEEGKKLLNEKAWEEIESLSEPSHEPAKVTSVNIKKMTPDPDPESVGRPTMFFLNEESGDAKAGI